MTQQEINNEIISYVVGGFEEDANSVSTSHAMAPTRLFQMLMNAVVIITSRF